MDIEIKISDDIEIKISDDIEIKIYDDGFKAGHQLTDIPWTGPEF